MASPTPQAAPAPPPPGATHRPAVFVHIDRFWHRVTEGLELSQLWNQFHADARASYRLYRKDFDARSPRGTRRHNVLHTAQEVIWAILEKLTPARRVLLLLGVLFLIFPGFSSTSHDSSGEIQVSDVNFHFLGGVLLLVVLMLEIADRVVMKRDLEIARDIQKWLLPATPPQVPGLAIAFAMRPANTVAGDFYDVFARPSDGGPPRFLVAIADVAGKSIPAALLMATFQASLRTLSETSVPLPQLVTGMNHYACTNSQSGLRFTTAFMAEFDPPSRTLTYINAGHNAPILRRTSGAVERLSQGGLPLGIEADRPYESGTVILQPGDWLLIFTDGLIEAENSREEEYGESRLLNQLQIGAGSNPDDLLRRVMTDLDIFVGPTSQHDDVTCLLLKVA
jgi:sigma-B regulation protein RsbU (phosphoserine phosphatase)